MLTLNADSVCDVCAEEYGPFNLPRCIPCGHVLCATCAETIIEKTSPRLAPLCPFCREGFSRDGVRVIRIDFSGSSGGGSSSGMNGIGSYGGGGGDGLGDMETCINGGAYSGPGGMDDETVLYDVRQSRSPIHSSRPSRDPSRAASPERAPHQQHQQNGIFTAINEDHHGLPGGFDVNAHKERARELEKKVAKVATKRCSAQEVQALQRELGDWLQADKMLGPNGLSSSDKQVLSFSRNKFSSAYTHAFATCYPQQHAAIHLSHLLLRAILMNHLAHSEASRVSKGAEAQLRARIADGELVREKLDEDLRRTKTLLLAKTHEVQALRTELGRVKGEESAEHGHSHAHGAVTPTRRQSLSAPTSPDGYFSYGYASTGISTASTAVPPSSRSNPASGTNSPSSSGRTTPTAGLALNSTSLMPMCGQFPPIGMTLSMSGAMGSMNGPGPGGGGERGGFMTTSGGTSSASAAASSSAARTFAISNPPARPQSTAPTRPGTSSASSTPARPQSTAPHGRGAPASPTSTSRYGGHARSASMIHRSATVVPGLSSSSASASAAASNVPAASTASAIPSRERDRRSMTPTPAPIHQRSASVAPGALSSSSASSAARGLTRSMTPNLSSSRSNAKDGTGQQMGNGSSAGGANYGVASGIPPVPPLPSSGLSGLSRPPVPPKPRTLSQSPSQGRGVVDDRDGYSTEKESSKRGEKEKKERKMHERWLPSALMDRMTRPATSLG
ncbi:hypothetical protein A7U60_g5962 [Sanghuangporus baumii]|uniref:RING-type domain-containing protein n=1 Tax=Sanghuangporus baumii TaxID=108892 RepID=A0A9Q5HW67_SANBA|nr:hypothetical protein A7U60_g5962 [Sanghuangporus baumii]